MKIETTIEQYELFDSFMDFLIEKEEIISYKTPTEFSQTIPFMLNFPLNHSAVLVNRIKFIIADTRRLVYRGEITNMKQVVAFYNLYRNKPLFDRKEYTLK